MDIELLTLDELTELLVIFAKNLLPEDDFSQGSDNWVRIRVVAGAGLGINAMLLSIYRDLWADTASEEALERHGNLRNLPRLGPVQASADNAILVKGLAGATWLTTDPIVHVNGQRYFPAASGTVGATGQELVGIIAEEGGLSGNLEVEESLTWESSLTDIEDEIKVKVAIDGGTNNEDLGAYRTRVLNRIAQPAMGGNQNDYEQWILEAGYAKGYIWPHRNGQGSVDIGALKNGSGSTRLLTLSERNVLQAYVDLRRPVSTGTIRVLEVVAETLDVEVEVIEQVGEDNARDWSSTTPPIVLSWTASTRTLLFDAARPDSMAVGGRLVVDGTSGVQLEIESLSGTDGVVLKDAKGQTPVALAETYSGSATVESARDSILALFDSLGPRGNEFGTGLWVSTMYHSHLFRDVQNSNGVLDSNITLPAADSDPTKTSYPVDDGLVNLLVAGNVQVRHA